MSDRDAREAALDPSQSFIVQAPAGSGKTELLIQRYLTLLGTVDEPEQVVAITFTRKAAAEMRNRVYRALRSAAERDNEAQSHQAKTSALARAALHRNDRLDWSLLTQPRRLRIETLDALNARLARQLPTSSGGAAGARIAEDAAELYQLAAQRTVEELTGNGEVGRSVRALLRHFDNSVPRLESLLADLLPRREQWLHRFAAANETDLRQDLELALRRLVSEELRGAATMLPDNVRRELRSLLMHAARHAAGAESRRMFEAWAETDVAETLALDALETWRVIAHLLLTKQGKWRRKLDRSIGFGPGHPQERERLQGVLDDLGGDTGLEDALGTARSLPEPRYSAEQWNTMAALRVVLRRLAAELRVVLAEAQTVDFVELAMAAQQALGHADAPSELLLALDRRIQHLLVDEFQDTSHSQLRLLELMTAGWESGDGRTLFLVGDPMQSIYRFRDADMSLFLKVQQLGIGSIRCRSLSLERNFRSAPAVVEWLNETFSRAFPSEDDMGSGAAKFSPCTATRAAAESAEVHVHALRSADHGDELVEAMAIITGERHRDPTQSIAVLVQSRTHLAGLHEHLRAQGLQVHAVEIDPLHEHQTVQDLIGLTRALTHLGDRVAWLAVLRAPWCGIGWRDLETLCRGARDRTIWDLLNDPTAAERIGEDARQRLAWLRQTLSRAFRERGEHGFADWVERTWMSLDGAGWLRTADDRRHAEQFFTTLEGIARRGDIDDPAALEAAFRKPRPQAEAAHDAGVEIMTIHRAKGLEFDTVILFGLGRAPRREDQKALYWMERVAADGSDDLIVAPLLPSGREDRLTEFVKRAEDARERAERTRLLYVAATRARERLHLVCHVEPATKTPSPRTLLIHLWPQIAHRFGPGENSPGASADEFEEAEVEREEGGQESVQPMLGRFADGFATLEDFELQAPARAAASRETRPEFEWASAPAVHVGTVVHRYLQRIAAAGIAEWSAARVRSSIAAFRRELVLLGLEPEEAEAAAQRVCEALQGVLDDPRGRWIFEPHEDARSEVRLTVYGGTVLEHIQLDRTFVDADGTRWIIDFKTGMHEGGSLDDFLNAEVERYRPQLRRYADTMAAVEDRPIRVGLYFPLLRAFRSWRPFE